VLQHNTPASATSILQPGPIVFIQLLPLVRLYDPKSVKADVQATIKEPVKITVGLPAFEPIKS
jgi:hypothetical protein